MNSAASSKESQPDRFTVPVQPHASVLTLAEAAAYVKISPRLLRYFVAGRKIRFARIGQGRGRIIFKRAWLDEFLDQASEG